MDDLYRLLKQGPLEAQGIVDTLDAPVAMLNEQLGVIDVNPAFCDAFGIDREWAIGRRLCEPGNGYWNGPDLRRLRGGSRTIMMQFDDVSDRRDRDAAPALLPEARHRARNLFALARVLATETEAEGLTGIAYRDAFLGRFGALLKGQTLQEQASKAEFSTVAEHTLEPFAARIRTVPGPAAPLAATQTMPMVMVLPELMSNAAKFGALSTREGDVRLSWQVARRGLGSRLLQFAVAKGLSGVSPFNFEPDGLRMSISLPVG